MNSNGVALVWVLLLVVFGSCMWCGCDNDGDVPLAAAAANASSAAAAGDC